MRAIEIGTDVFAKIWAMREFGEEDEDAILRRLLGISVQRTPELSSNPCDADSEAAPSAVHMQGRVLWRDDIRRAIEELGGKAHLGSIYRKVREIRRASGRSVPTHLEAVVRRELENNSSSSRNWTKERDWFVSSEGIGAGVWALQPGPIK